MDAYESIPSTSKEVVVLKPVSTSMLDAIKHFICSTSSERFDSQEGDNLLDKAWNCLNKTSLYLRFSTVKFVDACLFSNSLAPMLVSHHVIDEKLNSWIGHGFLENFNNLPNELLAKIFSNLSADDLQNVRHTCRRFNMISKHYRSVMSCQELDCLEMTYSNQKWLMVQPRCSDSINLFSSKKQKVYQGTIENAMGNFAFFKLRIQMDSIDEKLIQDLCIRRIHARRVHLYLNSESKDSIMLTRHLIVELLKNWNIEKVHVLLDNFHENLMLELNNYTEETSKFSIEVLTRSRSSSMKIGL